MKDRIKEVVKETLKEIGYICVEINVMFGKNNKKLKVVIHKKGRDISMNDCADVSIVLRRKLDMLIPNFSQNYDLIVESPGVNRRLKNLEEVEMFSDKEIEFNLKRDNNKTGKIIGKLKKITKDKLEIMDENNIIYNIKWDNVSSAKIYFDIKKYI